MPCFYVTPKALEPDGRVSVLIVRTTLHGNGASSASFRPAYS